jgi:hypothetical protein
VRKLRSVVAVFALLVVSLGLFQAGRVSANTGDPVILGADNNSDFITQITNTHPSQAGLSVLGVQAGLYANGRAGVTANGTIYAVYGATQDGEGVRGISTTGVGVHAESGGPGTALQVTGPATFSQSGVATVPAGKTEVTVQASGLKTGSFVLATMQDLGAIGTVKAAADPAAGIVTIRLSKRVSVATRVAWLVLS